MNKKTILFAATVLGLFASSCRKDVVNEKRLKGSWIIQEYKVDSHDLMKDSLETTFGPSTIKYKFSSASIIFEEDGDFTENINGGISISSNYYGYSYNNSIPISGALTGVWQDLDKDLLMTFDSTSSNNYYSYSFGYYSSPANSRLVSGTLGTSNPSYDFTELYDIIKLTKESLEMQGLNSSGKLVYIKASKL